MQAVKRCLFQRNVLKYMKYHAYSTRGHLLTVPLRGRNEQLVRKCSFDEINRLGSALSTAVPQDEFVDSLTYERVCEETLESLSEYFEQIIEDSDNFKAADVSYSSGVLTVNLGTQFGTYVINRQSPNRQIWLSSPTSGPKRYDFVVGEQFWVYKHNNEPLHRLLQDEISKIAQCKVDFSQCAYAKL